MTEPISCVGRYEEKKRCKCVSGSLELNWVTPYTHTHTRFKFQLAYQAMWSGCVMRDIT